MTLHVHCKMHLKSDNTYSHAFMVAVNALQLLLQLVVTDWADYKTVYNIVAANYIAVRYFVATCKPCK